MAKPKIVIGFAVRPVLQRGPAVFTDKGGFAVKEFLKPAEPVDGNFPSAEGILGARFQFLAPNFQKLARFQRAKGTPRGFLVFRAQTRRRRRDSALFLPAFFNNLIRTRGTFPPNRAEAVRSFGGNLSKYA